ncbi:unnamed protein product [Adineta ricciae]|uniref:Atos-like conserved domain-containing protein n=1 Tax=Adineta ricciae TaxID=249248 RepID=A0A814ULR5_ADIRI|nr:unnamed protein product [Adineta ricciae]
MLESSSIIESTLPGVTEVDLSKRKTVSKRQTISNRYHRLHSSSTENLPKAISSMNQSAQQPNQHRATVDGSIDSIWSSSGNEHLPTEDQSNVCNLLHLDDDHHHLLKSLPLNTFYSNSSSRSSFDLCSNSRDSHPMNTPEIPIFSSSSSGYDSSLNSIPDHLFSSSPNSIIIPDCNSVEQCVTLHRQKQPSFHQGHTSSPPSSFSSSSSSFFSSQPISKISSPSFCRKCASNNQASSDTDDDSQATTVSMNLLSLQSNQRPRSLPIAIQQPKSIVNDDETDNSSQNSPLCHCSISNSQKSRFRPCDLSPDTYPETNLTTPSTDKLHINEQVTINQKNSLEHFIMSPTDRVKVQMKYQENDTKSNELRISQPEEIDFKRSKLKAIRILYQNRLNLNSISSPVTKPNLIKHSSKIQGHCDSPLAKRTANPRLFRSALSYSVFEADDEHEVVLSSARSGVNGTHGKSMNEPFNSLRVNFIESLLHGKILPCGILDGFTVKLGASGLFIPKQAVLPVTTFWFNVSEHQAASPYLGFINLQSLPKRGYHTPTKGTITLALLNPNGTAVHLFLIVYDFSDMPADHRTFIRQRIVLMPENSTHQNTVRENLRYLAHIRFVTSQTGKLYMHSDIRLIFARNKLDYDERSGNGKPQLVTLTDVPTPKYWPRK